MSGDSGKRPMVFVDACRPQLVAGEYTLTAIQTLGIATDPSEPATTWTAEKKFWVRGPRFALASDEIYSLYPPDGQTGAFHDTVPHVVFRRKSLPWERKLDAKATGPWIALLLLDEVELSHAKIATTALPHVVRPPDRSIRGPEIILDAWEAEKADRQSGQVDSNICRTIDISGKVFFDLVPRRDELALLAHARNVGTDDKEDVAGIGDGWFSVLLGNRLPAKGQRNTALVVVGGFGDLIERKEPSALPETVRLVVLATWSFVEKGTTFRELLSDLGKRPDPWLRVTPPAPLSNEPVRIALQQGYVPLPHRLRNGGQTVSWYRGPLVPESIDPEFCDLIYRCADEALQFDAEVGQFNVSYAAAWQLGRLLALQAPAFATALFSWKDGLVAQALIGQAATKIKAMGLLDDAPAGMTELTSLLQDELMTAIALEWCG